MYLEHISMVHSVWGDISRTAAVGKKKCLAFGPLTLALWRLADPGRLARQRSAVIAVALVLLLRRQLQKPHLTGVALNQCSFAPTPHPHAVIGEGRDEEASHPPFYIPHWASGASRKSRHWKSISKSPSQHETISDISRKRVSGLLC